MHQKRRKCKKFFAVKLTIWA